VCKKHARNQKLFYNLVNEFMLRKICWRLGLLIFVFIITACSKGGGDHLATPVGGYPVDPTFQGFYKFLGGQDVLGAAISPAFVKNDNTYQFTDSALMVYDPKAPASEHFRLASLGLEMGVEEPAVQPPIQKELVYVDGHIIYPDFLAMYNQLDDGKYVGRPLAEVRYNADKKRYEQYFEKVGFYRSEEDPTVHLLAYGDWKCDMNCRSSAPLNSIIDVPKLSQNTEPEIITTFGLYFPFISRLSPNQSLLTGSICCNLFFPYLSSSMPGLAAFREATNRLPNGLTGPALTDPFITTEGKLMQIFLYAAATASPEKPGQVAFVPVPKKLGTIPDPLEGRSKDPMMFFYPVEGEKGYNIPPYFVHFLELYGGLDVSGAPITRFSAVNDAIYRQCFVNLCLEENRNTSQGVSIHPTALGTAYKNLFFPEIPSTTPEVSAGPQVSFQVWKTSPMVSSDKSQEIGVQILENNTPLSNVEPYLMLTLPDGKQKTFSLPPTGENGQSRLTLPPVPASSGTYVPFQVCIARMTGEKFCVKDSFIIWNNP
jgi:hypothetical protein